MLSHVPYIKSGKSCRALINTPSWIELVGRTGGWSIDIPTPCNHARGSGEFPMRAGADAERQGKRKRKRKKRRAQGVGQLLVREAGDGK